MLCFICSLYGPLNDSQTRMDMGGARWDLGGRALTLIPLVCDASAFFRSLTARSSVFWSSFASLLIIFSTSRSWGSVVDESCLEPKSGMAGNDY